ncbi:hypothetical protein JOM56_001482 [Amanita muscaria]
MLNIGRMLGAGIYAVPGPILHSVGSVGMLLANWIIAPLFAYGNPDLRHHLYLLKWVYLSWRYVVL